ncbi:MAG: PGF-CTERM sorting domain-containing protein [Haloarculaceae archaeon]
MKGKPVFLMALIMVIATATIPGIVVADDPPFNPDDVEIVSINGEDPDQVNDVPIHLNEDIRIELSGVEEFDRPVRVEIGGELLSYIDEPTDETRPRSGSDVTTGQQTLQVVYEDRGERTVIAQTEVDVTEVVLDRDELSGDVDKLDYDPENVEVASVNGQDADQVNDIEVVWNEEIELELDGMDTYENVAWVELDGTFIGYISEGENSFRPLQNRDISEGQQTLSLYLDRTERIDIAETQVDVTRVDLTQDDKFDLDFDPAAVSLDTINGQDASDLSLSLRYNETVSISLDGLDATNHVLIASLDGETIGFMDEGEDSFRPRSDADVEPGEHQLIIRKRLDTGGRVVVAETTVTVTEVQLDRDDDRQKRPEFDPEAVSIDSVNGESPDQRNELRLERGSSLEIELDGAEVPDRGFFVEIDGEVIGVLESSGEPLRIRSDSDVSEGDQTLAVVWDSGGDRTVLAETAVHVAEVNLGEPTDPETVDLEIVSVNGQSADGVVVIEHDLRGETPIELEVAGLSDTELEPSIRYKNQTLPADMDSFSIQGDQISLDHLPRVEDGETEELELVTRTGDDEFHVYDSVKLEYRHVEDGEAEGKSNDDEDSVDADGPGFGIGGALTGIGGAAYLLNRRLSEDESE